MRPPQAEAGATPLPHQPIDGHGDALPGSRPGASGLPETDSTKSMTCRSDCYGVGTKDPSTPYRSEGRLTTRISERVKAIVKAIMTSC